MTTATKMLTLTEIRKVLAEGRQIVIVWGVDDVQDIRPDLDEAQCWDVLQSAGRHHDAERGINWTVLEATAAIMYPRPSTADAEDA